MADTRKETVILDFQVTDQGALSELAETKKAIIGIKQEQKELNEEYKKGNVSVDDYAAKTVKLEASLKKQNAAYSETQRQVTGLKSPFDKLNQSITDQIKQVNIAGVSLANFANPATAAIAVVGGLAAAYAHSTTGAKDLEFASNSLGIATDLLSEKFAKMISSSEDGQGAISKQVTGFFNNITTFANAFGADSTFGKDIEHGALVIEKLQDLQREETKILAANADRRADNAELQTKILDSQTSYNERLKLADQILANAKQNQEDLVKIKQEELNGIRFQLSLDKENEAIQDKVAQAELGLSQARKATARDIKAAEVSKSNIIDANTKLVKQETDLAKQMDAQARAAKLEASYKTGGPKDIFDEEDLIATAKISSAEKVFAVTQSLFDKKIGLNEKENESEKQKAKIAELEAANRLATISSYLGQAQALFSQDSAAYKVMGIGRATVDTYRAADLALATYPPPFGEIAAGFAIATGLANVAKILDVQFSAGGYTGDGGKYQPAGIVHAGEVVWNQADVAAVGGAARANAMRPSFSDGGIVANGMTSGMMMNRNQPSIQVVLDYKEFTEFTNGVTRKVNYITG